jgi:hypothetical protein
MSWLCSRALVEEFLEDTSLDGELSALLNGNHTPQAFCASDRTKAFSRLSRSGMTFAPLTDGLGEDLLTWFREDFLAKTSPLRGPTEVTKGRDLTERSPDSGLRCSESFARLSPSGSWLKTPPTSGQKGLELSSKAWPRAGTMRRGACYQQPTLEPITSGNESGFWGKRLPTPTAHNAKEGAYPAEGTRKTPTLGWELGGKPNPAFVEWMMGWPIGWTDLKPLGTDKFHSWQQQHFNSFNNGFKEDN